MDEPEPLFLSNSEPEECIDFYNFISLCVVMTHYSMEQNLSWEANQFAASQEVHHILWNPKVYYCSHKCPSPVPILCQCILPSITLRTVKLKPLEYSVNALHYPCSIHSWKNNVSGICILITLYFLRLRKQVTINIVVAVLSSVLLNCRGAYCLSCWTAMVFKICPVELTWCTPSVLLNCWGA
jgi:hypothetical protein